MRAGLACVALGLAPDLRLQVDASGALLEVEGAVAHSAAQAASEAADAEAGALAGALRRAARGAAYGLAALGRAELRQASYEEAWEQPADEQSDAAPAANAQSDPAAPVASDPAAPAASDPATGDPAAPAASDPAAPAGGAAPAPVAPAVSDPPAAGDPAAGDIDLPAVELVAQDALGDRASITLTGHTEELTERGETCVVAGDQGVELEVGDVESKNGMHMLVWDEFDCHDDGKQASVKTQCRVHVAGNLSEAILAKTGRDVHLYKAGLFSKATVDMYKESVGGCKACPANGVAAASFAFTVAKAGAPCILPSDLNAALGPALALVLLVYG